MKWLNNSGERSTTVVADAEPYFVERKRRRGVRSRLNFGRGNMNMRCLFQAGFANPVAPVLRLFLAQRRHSVALAGADGADRIAVV